MKPPPEVFTTPLAYCPSCNHGIDPHGTDPGGICGVGYWDTGVTDYVTCRCQWSPNDIAVTLLAQERERIAQALEAEKDRQMRLAKAINNGRESYVACSTLSAFDAAGIARGAGTTS